MIRSILFLGPMVGMLAACGNGAGDAPFDGADRMLGAELVHDHEQAPPGAEPGTCWGRDVTPAIVETLTEQRIIRPSAAGSGAAQDAAAPVYRTDTRQRIVRAREEFWFRTPCAHEITPTMVETLQRALAARGIYDGATTGRMDRATRRAVRAYQRPQGLDSGLLSLTAARQLGLVEYDFAEG